MKKIWKENRVLFVLFLILIICFIAICSVTISYFVGSHKSVYGERLDNKVEIKKDVENDYIAALESNDIIKKATFRVSIRTIYVYIIGNDKSTLDSLKEKAELSLEKLPEEVLAYYDVNFILEKNKSESDDGFTLMGAKNSNSESVSWNNKTEAKEE